MKIYENPLSEGNPDQIKGWAKTLNELTFENATRSKLFQLYKAATNWDICACGNLCKLIPRVSLNKPEDAVLAALGNEFSLAISEMRAEFHSQRKSKVVFLKLLAIAKVIHQKIESRAIVILANLK